MEYEQAAIDGLGTMKIAPKAISFTQSDGTPQFISARCSPGFVAHVVAGGEKLSAIAGQYGTTESALFDHPYNKDLKALRVTADKIQDGDVVYIPRNSTMKMLDGHYL